MYELMLCTCCVRRNVWMHESINVWVYDCMNVTCMDVCTSLYDCITIYDRWDSKKWDKTCRMGGGLTSQYKHSANFLGDDIIVNKSRYWWCKTWHKVAIDASWKDSPLLSKVWKKSPFVNRHRVFFPRHASAVMFFVVFFFKSLTFAWIAYAGFQSTRNIFLYAPNFFLDHPFRFSVHRDAQFFLSRLFRFST